MKSYEKKKENGNGLFSLLPLCGGVRWDLETPGSVQNTQSGFINDGVSSCEHQSRQARDDMSTDNNHHLQTSERLFAGLGVIKSTTWLNKHFNGLEERGADRFKMLDCMTRRLYLR